MEKHSFKSILLLASIMNLLTTGIHAQCNPFVKKVCKPKILPFTDNGQVNIKTLTAGEKTTLNVNFFAGQAYRILVCAEELLGAVTFIVTDATHAVVFDSNQHDQVDFWDFRMRSSQSLQVEITAPPSTSTSSILPTGCVSIMVGFKN